MASVKNPLTSVTSAIDKWWYGFTKGWHKTNCLFFALALYYRRHHRILAASEDSKLFGRRHYFVMRKSDSGKFPHFLYQEHMPYSGIRSISYKPPHPIDRKCPPVLFDGVARWGDTRHSEAH